MNYQDHDYGLDNTSDPSYAEMLRHAASSGDRPILDTDPFGLNSSGSYGSYLPDDDTNLYDVPSGQPSHFHSLQYLDDHDHSNDPSDSRVEAEEGQDQNDSATGREEKEEQEKDDEIQDEGHGWSWLTKDDANAKQQRVWCSVKNPNRQTLSEIIVLLRLNRKNGEISNITAVPSFPGFSPAQKEFWDIVTNRESAFQSLSTAISLIRPGDCMEIREKAQIRGNEEANDRWMIKMANARLGKTNLWFGGQEHKVIFRQAVSMTDIETGRRYMDDTELIFKETATGSNYCLHSNQAESLAQSLEAIDQRASCNIKGDSVRTGQTDITL